MNGRGGGDLWPRDAEHRYRLYARKGGALTVLAAAPSLPALGGAIGTLDEDHLAAGRRLADEGQIGIYDCRPGERTGRWIVPPFPPPKGAS